MRRAGSYLLLIAVTAWAGGAAGDDTRPLKDKRPRAKSGAIPGITPEREAAVTTFAKQYHPELAELLVKLKEGMPGEYERAVRDIFRASERLAQIQENDAERYELELEAWKLDSRIHLLTARVNMSSSEDLRTQLKATLREKSTLRKKALKRERERLAEQLKSVDTELSDLDRKGEQLVENQFRNLLKHAGEFPKRPAKNDPAAKSAKSNSKGST